MINALKNLLNGNSGSKESRSTEPVQQDIVGIDISHSYIRVVQLAKKNKKWALTKLGSKILEESYESKDKRNEAIVSHLKNLKLEQKINFDNAAISLPVNSAIVQVIQIPFLEDEELKEAADNGSLWDSSVNVPGEISEYSIFWQAIKRDRVKNTLSLLFVASRIDEIEKSCDLVRKAGYDPLIVDVRCFALRNILKTYDDAESHKTKVFIEISGQENYAVCMFDSLPFIYDIYVSDDDSASLINGGDLLTDDLFSRLASQIRTCATSFTKQSGVASIELIELSSSLPNAEKIYAKLKKEIVEYKIQLMTPLETIQVPVHLKSRIETEKNLSSFAIAIGLATRQLDVFGYFKFVTAVSNINLLPNREDRIKKEKKKSVTSSVTKKLSIVSSAVLLILTASYGYMLLETPSLSDIQQKSFQAADIESEVGLKQEELSSLKLWTEDSGSLNGKILDISYTSLFPNGTYINEINQKRGEKSLVTFAAKDASLTGNIMDIMTKRFENVMMQNILAPTTEGQLNTMKISYEIK